jgi:hypothetical protein
MCIALFRAHQQTSGTTNPHDIATQAKIGLETLTRLYFLRHSFDTCDVFLCNFLAYLANIAIEALNNARTELGSTSSHADIFRSTLILCVQVSTFMLFQPTSLTLHRASKPRHPTITSAT